MVALLYYRTLQSVKIESAKTKIFFIAFLDELGNFKHFEPYLFFLVKSAAECGRTVRPGADRAVQCG